MKTKCNLIIKNLHENISSKQLDNECQKIGPTISCYIKKKEVDGEFKSLGYGYVSFESEEDAKKFLEEFNGKELNDQKI